MPSMMIRILLRGKEQHLERKRARIETLLHRLHLNPETTLVVRNGLLLTEDEDLFDGDTALILSTVDEP